MSPEEAQAVLNKIQYKEFKITLDLYGDLAPYSTVTIGHRAPDVHTGKIDWVKVSRAVDLPLIDEEYLLTAVRLLILSLEEHEVFEHLLYDGKHLVDPHPGISPKVEPIWLKAEYARRKAQRSMRYQPVPFESSLTESVGLSSIKVDGNE